MELSAVEQGMLLAMALGFAICVALLHLGETAVLAIKLRAWMPMWWSGTALVLVAIFLAWQIGLQAERGVRFADILVVFGGQLGLLVCLPSRWLSRRKCRWDLRRAQLQVQASWWQQASDPQHPSRFVSPGHPDAPRAGVGPHGR